MSTFAVIGLFLNHSGAMYPVMSLMAVSVRVWSLIRSFANPKSEILAVNESSRSTFWGLISQWMSPRAIPNAIWVRIVYSGIELPKRKLANVPLHMNSQTKSLCGPSSQNPINLTKFLWWVIAIVLASVLNSLSPSCPNLSNFLTATWVPELDDDKTPLYTVPKAPLPSSSLNPSVACLSSS